MNLSVIKTELEKVGLSATEDEILDRLQQNDLAPEDISIDAIDLVLELFSTGTAAPATSIAPIPAAKPAKGKGKGGAMTRTQRAKMQAVSTPQQVQEIPIAAPFNSTADQLAPFVEALGEKTNAIEQAAGALAYLNSNFAALVINRASEIEAATGRSTADFSAYLADCRSGMQLINDRMAELGFAGWNEEDSEDASAA